MPLIGVGVVEIRTRLKQTSRLERLKNGRPLEKTLERELADGMAATGFDRI